MFLKKIQNVGYTSKILIRKIEFVIIFASFS